VNRLSEGYDMEVQEWCDNLKSSGRIDQKWSGNKKYYIYMYINVMISFLSSFQLTVKMAMKRTYN